MTYFLKTSDTVYLKSSDSVSIDGSLDVCSYVIRKDAMTGELFLQKTSPLTQPKKLYGDTLARAERIVNTYIDRNKNTGSLHLGKKGSGKSLITKVISDIAHSKGIPTILVNSPFAGQPMNDLFNLLGKTRVVVVFDEFDKVYDQESQEEILTLLDGTVDSNALFLFTANYGSIDSHMINRPGRIFYKFEYAGIGPGFARDYCMDCLDNKDHIEDVVRVSEVFKEFTFDMLQALVEELNRYGESVESAMKYLNIDFFEEQVTYDIEMFVDGKPLDNRFYPTSWNGNPFLERNGVSIDVYFNDENWILKESDGIDDIKLNQSRQFKISSGGRLMSTFVENGRTIEAIFSPIQQKQYNIFRCF